MGHALLEAFFSVQLPVSKYRFIFAKFPNFHDCFSRLRVSGDYVNSLRHHELVEIVIRLSVIILVVLITNQEHLFTWLHKAREHVDSRDYLFTSSSKIRLVKVWSVI